MYDPKINSTAQDNDYGHISEQNPLKPKKRSTPNFKLLARYKTKQCKKQFSCSTSTKCKLKIL